MTDFSHYMTFCHVVNMLDEALLGSNRRAGMLFMLIVAPTPLSLLPASSASWGQRYMIQVSGIKLVFNVSDEYW